MAINLQEVCNVLETQTCPIHNKKPTAKVNGGKIEIVLFVINLKTNSKK